MAQPERKPESVGREEERIEISQKLSSKLSNLNLQVPTLSAVAQKGDEKVATQIGQLFTLYCSEIMCASVWD